VARALALDLGSKRIGVASSDTTRTLASPVTVLERRGNHAADHKAIADIIAEYEPDVLVVGLPLSLTGAEGHATKLIRDEVAEMELVFQIPIVFHDERFTTATAHASMKERKMNEKDRRKVVDKVAAAVLLQAWLDGEHYRAKATRAKATAANDAAANDAAGNDSSARQSAVSPS
jgi:putative holliday junction resolvase